MRFPSLKRLGTFVPAWLLCTLVGVGVAIAAHQLVRATRLGDELRSALHVTASTVAPGSGGALAGRHGLIVDRERRRRRRHQILRERPGHAHRSDERVKSAPASAAGQGVVVRRRARR
ncbi:MAG TPA: hypothetical protein VIA18_17695 [Polyangia bacterium]|jgi:hypothetical protein|nr:hypothetical protein [Polyangia bacterium]HWE27936.1 hypothetical protein [Polyangia bacterium]